MNFKKKLLYVIGIVLMFSPGLYSETVQQTAAHAREKSPTIWDFLVRPAFATKFGVMLLLGIIALVLLKTKKMNKGIKIGLLLITTFLFGIAGNFTRYFMMHPSPICAGTKSILYGFGMPLIITLAVIFLLTLIGPKLFCGWVCPVGAIQELIAMLADKLGIKRGKTSFTAAHTVRVFIFILFIFLSATKILSNALDGTVYAVSLYDYINPFHGLEFGTNDNLIDYLVHYLPFALTVIFAFKYYRSFCHFVCPIGLYTHWLEQVSLFRIRFKKEKCNDCGICTTDTPCTAIPEIMKGSTLRPDCFACNECIAKCGQQAFGIGCKR